MNERGTFAGKLTRRRIVTWLVKIAIFCALVCKIAAAAALCVMGICLLLLSSSIIARRTVNFCLLHMRIIYVRNGTARSNHVSCIEIYNASAN